MEIRVTRMIEAMLDAIEHVHAIIGSSSADEVSRNITRQWAVERGFEIISEASRAIPPEIKAKFPEQRWRSIAAIGNHLRHRFWEIDTLLLWETTLWDLPTLGEALQTILEAEGGNGAVDR